MCISDWSSDLCSSDLPFEIADTPAGKLCRAYVEQDADKRLNALDALWTGDLRSRDGYASRILTARAAARIEPDEDLVDQASALVGSMLSAGMARQAARRWPVLPGASDPDESGSEACGERGCKSG